MKRVTLGAAIVIMFIAAGIIWLRPGQAEEIKQNTRVAAAPQQAETPPEPTNERFDARQHAIDQAASIWMIVNKKRPLAPLSYVPGQLVVPGVTLRSNITADEKQLRSETAAALQLLFQDAANDRVTLTLQSGYRSYGFQRALYDRYVRVQGQAVADTESARPGHSEHQTGLAADVGGITNPGCNIEACFAETIEGKWITARAHEYGFIIRYPSDKTPVTGYIYEPWHLRYVGRDLAVEMKKRGISTLEEFFGLPPAPSYH